MKTAHGQTGRPHRDQWGLDKVALQYSLLEGEPGKVVVVSQSTKSKTV